MLSPTTYSFDTRPFELPGMILENENAEVSSNRPSSNQTQFTRTNTNNKNDLIVSLLQRNEYTVLEKITQKWAKNALQLFKDNQKKNSPLAEIFYAANTALKKTTNTLSRLKNSSQETDEKFQKEDVYISFPLDKMNLLGENARRLESLEKEEYLLRGVITTQQTDKIIYIQNLQINPNTIKCSETTKDSPDLDAELAIIQVLADKFFTQGILGIVIYDTIEKKAFYEKHYFSVEAAGNLNRYSLNRDQMAVLTGNSKTPTPQLTLLTIPDTNGTTRPLFSKPPSLNKENLNQEEQEKNKNDQLPEKETYNIFNCCFKTTNNILS